MYRLFCRQRVPLAYHHKNHRRHQVVPQLERQVLNQRICLVLCPQGSPVGFPRLSQLNNLAECRLPAQQVNRVLFPAGSPLNNLARCQQLSLHLCHQQDLHVNHRGDPRSVLQVNHPENQLHNRQHPLQVSRRSSPRHNRRINPPNSHQGRLPPLRLGSLLESRLGSPATGPRRTPLPLHRRLLLTTKLCVTSLQQRI